ncbi:hypothetical protein KA119_02350 [Candidatus Gracilibacteria bacterium]|nr:hypothetical protein [Candidatus Gracilibacteria bacterium]
MERIIVLGSTGNLGVQMLEILDRHTDKFQLVGLTGYSNRELLEQQATKYQVAADTLETIDLSKADIIINLLAGLVGIEPTLRAQSLGKKILLANKESLIACPEIDPKNVIPVDSEHNAIYEILKTRPQSPIKQILLPCSGGPFLGWTREQIANTTLEQALAHPRYQMGAKISIESAFLLNKAFEVLEAHILFQVPLEKIRVIIHPECQIHAAVTFENNETLAYIAPPDMREHLENALLDHCNPTRIQPLTDLDFPEPDYPNFPLFHKTIEAYKRGRIKEFLEEEESLIQEILKGEKTLSSFLVP